MDVFYADYLADGWSNLTQPILLTVMSMCMCACMYAPAYACHSHTLAASLVLLVRFLTLFAVAL